MVTPKEIIKALRGPIGAVGNAKRKELANRIESEGIAPPDGWVLVLAFQQALPSSADKLQSVYKTVKDCINTTGISNAHKIAVLELVKREVMDEVMEAMQ